MDISKAINFGVSTSTSSTSSTTVRKNVTEKAVVVISGGLDSSTLLHRIHADYPNHKLYGISFDYGQRHHKELEFAAYQVATLKGHHEIVDMSFMGTLFAQGGSKSSLISDTAVPEGHYAESNMSATVVPNRNMIMMSIAAGYAVSLGANILVTGVHGGDHFIYPDCRPEFFDLLDRAVYVGNAGFIKPDFKLVTPYMFKTKADIAYDAFTLGVDVSRTWSCYKGGDEHCGKCGTCVERIEAIHEAGQRATTAEGLSGAKDEVNAEGVASKYEDPTIYEDYNFWREALTRETVKR